MQKYLTGVLESLIYLLPIVLISLSVHECAHGYVAFKLGDPTAKQQGRLSLNPLRHIDPLGLLMMLFVRFGWAKPVPVNPVYFKNPQKGMMLTALAGPVSNLILAVISSFFTVITVFCSMFLPESLASGIFIFFYQMTMVNTTLALFNLIPVYPLDGARILGYFLPNRISEFFVRNSQMLQIIFIILIVLPGFVPFVPDIIGLGIRAVQEGVTGALYTVWSWPLSRLFSLFL